MKLNLLSMSLLAVLLTACTFSETKKDNQIDPQIKAQLHTLNNQVVEGLINNKPENVLAVCSDKLLEKKRDIKILMQALNGNLKDNSFKILNEYYQKNAAKKNLAEVTSGTTGKHDYTIRYESLYKEMYVMVGYFKDSMNQKSFTFIYGKQGNVWKLNILQAGIYKIMNKDAYDWYAIAKSDYERGYLIDALCNIGLAAQLLKPANHLWQYQKEKEIEALEQKITKETYKKYPFPLTVTDVKTKPVIFRVYSQAIPEGYFPVILYTTTIDLQDVPALARECDEIHENIGKIFKGINTNNKLILYRPLKTIPTGTETGKQFGFKKNTN
ncbi:MAG: hypothetical protein Q8904_10470 [Bacteroidota bacterium]|nr:hypothetical protein [Bacteroidota bacterium]